jgi:BirA family biotin operon repressor/biotin-[acetyl-CoA-carboxylase] ligase
MNTPASPPLEPVVVSVLRTLWRAAWTRGPEALVSMQELLRDSAASLTQIQLALAEIEARQCTLRRTPSGVQLAATGIACWRDVLEDFAHRHDLRIGRRVLIFGATDSTNDVAWQCAGTPDAAGLVVLADVQSAGRGRLGHRWESRAGQSVLMSIVLRGSGHAESVDRLTLAAGLATAIGLERALERAGGRIADNERIHIKWPNDLLVRDRKIAGILVERRMDPAGGGGWEGGNIVVGIGINVAQQPDGFSPELRGAATSLALAAPEAAPRLDRSLIAAAVIESLDEALHDLMRGDGWVEEWKRRCTMLGARAQARSGERKFSGQIIDVDPLQGLVLRDDYGATHFLSAQTSTLSG